METLMMAAQKERPFAAPGAMVARHREARGRTQEDLARAVGVTTSMMSKIEQGLTKPGVANAHGLDVALETGHAIFAAYYGPANEDEVSTLRDEVAQLAQDLTELREIVDQLRRLR